MGHRVTVVHDDVGRLVAIKAPPADDPGRTRHEAEILRGVCHPGVVEILEPGADGPDLRTRWVGARTAADLPRPLDPDRAAGLVLAVAATVGDLHRAGIVHGNLDPTHVLLDPYGRPVLCGFGDADRLGGEHGPRASTDVAGLGGLLAGLLMDGDDDVAGTETGAARSWRRRTGRRRAGETRALLAVAEHAAATDPSMRPGLRAFVDAVGAAVPEPALPPEDGSLSRPPSSPTGPAPDAPAPAIDPLLALLADPEHRDEPSGVTIHAASVSPTPEAATSDRASSNGTTSVDHSSDSVRSGRAILDDPRHTGTGDESGFWDDLERLRPVSDPDRRTGRPSTWWGAAISIVGLAVVGFLGMSAVTGDPPVPEAAVAAPSTGPTSTATTSPRNTAPPTAPPSSAPPIGPQTTVEHDGRHYAVGEPGDLVAVGDWRCNGRSTPAVYRPGTGSLFVFDTWPGAGGRHEVEPLMALPGGDALTAGPLDPDGCPSLVVGLGDALPVVLRAEELR